MPDSMFEQYRDPSGGNETSRNSGTAARDSAGRRARARGTYSCSRACADTGPSTAGCESARCTEGRARENRKAARSVSNQHG
jgi:hypothetical protein